VVGQIERDTDRIYIRDLLVQGIIGVNDDERDTAQDILVNVALEVDARRAGASDEIHDAVDYGAVARELVAYTRGARHLLVEKLATELARLCLGHRGVSRATVRVEKPQALSLARSAGVEITRTRDDFPTAGAEDDRACKPRGD